MSKGKEVFLLILGGLGWLLLGIACVMAGALDNRTGAWLCVVALILGCGMVYWGVDRLLEPRRRW